MLIDHPSGASDFKHSTKRDGSKSESRHPRSAPKMSKEHLHKPPRRTAVHAPQEIATPRVFSALLADDKQEQQTVA